MENFAKITKLVSGSIFVEFDDEDEKHEIAGLEYIEEKYGQLEKQLTDLFDRSEKPVNRAVMAHILSELPVFFGNVEEIKNYVYRSLNACTDLAEKAAVVQILESMMQEELGICRIRRLKMEFCKGIYADDMVCRKLEKIEKKLQNAEFIPFIHVITLPLTEDGQLEIYPAYVLAQKEYQGLPFKVVGIASGREEALVLVEIMVNDCIDETGTVDLKAYLDF